MHITNNCQISLFVDENRQKQDQNVQPRETGAEGMTGGNGVT